MLGVIGFYDEIMICCNGLKNDLSLLNWSKESDDLKGNGFVLPGVRNTQAV